MPATQDPLRFLIAVMNAAAVSPKLRVAAAKAVLPHLRLPLGRGGKKDAQREAARRASKGLYAQGRAPVIRMKDFKPTTKEKP